MKRIRTRAGGLKSEEELLIKGDAVVSILVCVLLQVKFDAAVDSVSVEVEIKSNDGVGSLASAKNSNFGGGGARNSAGLDVISMEHTVKMAVAPVL